MTPWSLQLTIAGSLCHLYWGEVQEVSRHYRREPLAEQRVSVEECENSARVPPHPPVLLLPSPEGGLVDLLERSTSEVRVGQ